MIDISHVVNKISDEYNDAILLIVESKINNIAMKDNGLLRDMMTAYPVGEIPRMIKDLEVDGFKVEIEVPEPKYNITETSITATIDPSKVRVKVYQLLYNM